MGNMELLAVFKIIAAKVARVDNTTLFWILTTIVMSFMGGIGWIISKVNRVQDHCMAEDERIHQFCIVESNRMDEVKLGKDVFTQFEKHNAQYHQRTLAEITKLNKKLSRLKGWKEYEDDD